MRNRALIQFALLTTLLITAAPASVRLEAAPSPEQDARAILAERVRRTPTSEEYVGEIFVIGGDGRERRKVWRSYRSGGAGASNRLIRFYAPADVRGVAYLSRRQPGRRADEWLYVPSLKRERRIGARDRDAAFGGTSLSYEDLDLMDFDESRFDASTISSTTTGGVPTHVIAVVPREPSAYARMILTIRRDDLALLSVQYLEAGTERPIKRLILSDHARIDRYLMARRFEMVDLRTGVRTIVQRHDVVVDRPQPSDRFTIQNLTREDLEAPVVPVAPLRDSRTLQTADPLPRTVGVSGEIDVRGFGSFGSTRVSTWTSRALFLFRPTLRIGRLGIVAALAAETSSVGDVDTDRFDVTDRAPRRAALSLREAHVTVPVASAIDLQVGRFVRSWGETDGYSPSDVFFPRDLTDPLTEERLTFWAASLRGERGRVRFELLVAPTATPWRLPALDGRTFALGERRITLVELPPDAPTGGFRLARGVFALGNWDVGVWGRHGIRLAPVLEPRIDEHSDATGALVVPLERRYAQERAGGMTVAREVRGWILRGEMAVAASPDGRLGRTATWTIGGSRSIGQALFTATIAMRAGHRESNPVFSFDRGLLPSVVLGATGVSAWGTWGIGWLGTFDRVGGVLTAQAARRLTDAVQLTTGVDLPHGSSTSPATVFSGGPRGRASLHVAW